MDWPELNANEFRGCLEKPDWSLGYESLLSGIEFSPEDSGDSYREFAHETDDEDDDLEDEDEDTDVDVKAPSFEPPHHAHHSFSLPPDASIVRLLSRGSLAFGNVHVETGDTVNGSIEVNVSVAYWNEDALKHVLVCRLAKPPGPPPPRQEHRHGPGRGGKDEHRHPGEGHGPGRDYPGEGRKPGHGRPGREHGPEHDGPGEHGPGHEGPGKGRVPGRGRPGKERRPDPKHPVPHPGPPHGNKADGIGIFTPLFPRGPPGRNALRFNITVRIPPLNASDPNATHPALATSFTNFKHEFKGALALPAVFAKTTNSRIHVDVCEQSSHKKNTDDVPTDYFCRTCPLRWLC